MHETPQTVPQGLLHDQSTAHGVDPVELRHCRWMDDTGGVDDLTRGEPFEEVGHILLATDVTHIHPSPRQPCGHRAHIARGMHQRPDVGGVALSQQFQESAAEPAGGARDHECHANSLAAGCTPRWVRKCSALRMARAMTVPCGLMPGAPLTIEASLTITPATS